ncbi:hypothetical protein DFR52_101494 [Hoeflea marina]|uniref:Uncharacterized protein n=1 Tax=Hoeflea marina TaxID=274592 RepID=A0A317PU85_9HYPH|nr:hypothetical protein [Hoeflea marina]PWW03806.1 hypothetical protein DFR52_101494 [Hoeflea marina]
MQKLLGIKFWVTAFTGWLLGGIAFAVMVYSYLRESVRALLGGWSDRLIPAADTAVPMLMGLVVLVVFNRQVWCWACRRRVVGRILQRRVFPDLNGEWRVELTSNFPRLDAMQAAARSVKAPRYDTRAFEAVPLSSPLVLRARITQDWIDVRMELWSEDPASRIERSVTTSFDLSRGPDGTPTVAYFYRQTNRAESLTGTSQESFDGAARLVVAEDGTSMSGLYLARGNWDSGLNTAGTIRFTRI